jgi:hypothetical protein
MQSLRQVFDSSLTSLSLSLSPSYLYDGLVYALWTDSSRDKHESCLFWDTKKDKNNLNPSRQDKKCFVLSQSSEQKK